MAKLVQLTNSDTNENIYAKTPTKAVINADGSNLSAVEGIVKGDGEGNFTGVEATEVDLVDVDLVSITPDLIGAMPVISVTTADNGKFMRVVNGIWTAATIANANGVEF